MTPTRRTRKPGPKKSKLNRNVTESSEEESSDAGSVTRCICGEAHNLGLMVQCDKCEVWQHCECIGLIQEKLPDHYYCDQCQPENHQLIKTSSGRSKRLYNASVGLVNSVSPWLLTNTINGSNSDTVDDSKKPTKRRKTAQRTRPARNSSSPTSQQNTSESSSSPITTINSPTTNTDSLLLLEKMDNEQDKSILISPPPPLSSSPLAKSTVIADEVNNNTNSSDAEPLFMIEERLTRSRRTTTKTAADNNREDSQDIIEEATAPQRKKVKQQRAVSSSPSPHEPSSKRTTNSKHNNHNHKSIPQQQQVLFMDDFGSPISASTLSPYWNYTDGKPTRESSPPAKIKYPHSKMTFSDMNRRAKQIMDCILKIQVEELKKPVESPSSESNLINDQELILNRPRSLSTSSSTSSLSSASTVPLLDDYATTTSSASSPSTPIPFIPKHEETSIEILERVNRELTKFQRKFGIVYQQPRHYLRGANQSSPQQSPLGQTNGRLVSNSSNNNSTIHKK